MASIYVKGWRARDVKGCAPVVMHNDTEGAVPLTCLLLDSQSMVDLIANPRMLLSIRKMQSEETIRVYCNSRFKVVDRVRDLPGYRNCLVWTDRNRHHSFHLKDNEEISGNLRQ